MPRSVAGTAGALPHGAPAAVVATATAAPPAPATVAPPVCAGPLAFMAATALIPVALAVAASPFAPRAAGWAPGAAIATIIANIHLSALPLFFTLLFVPVLMSWLFLVSLLLFFCFLLLLSLFFSLFCFFFWLFPYRTIEWAERSSARVVGRSGGKREQKEIKQTDFGTAYVGPLDRSATDPCNPLLQYRNAGRGRME